MQTLLLVVNLIVFPGGFNWPVWVAQEKGFFAKNGLEIKVTPTPSSVFQLTNLIEGRFDIAMTAIDNLIAYREGQGEAKVDGPDLIAFMGGDDPGLVGGERKGWADANRDAVVGYIRAFSEAVDWLYDPRNRDEAVAIFRKNLPNVPEQGAQAAYGVLLAPRGGFQKKAQIDLEGVRTVLQLRSKYAEPKKSLTDPNTYYDPSFYRAAMR